MKVSIALYGRFHAFDLARELQAKGCLHQLITSYPKYGAERFGVDRDKVESIAHCEVLGRLLNRLPLSPAIKSDVNARLLSWFDRLAARRLAPDADVLVGWSGSCLKIFDTAKANGTATVLERGSSHILHQVKTLTEEYARHGIRYSGTGPRIINRELAGYEKADRIAVPSTFVKKTFLDHGFSDERVFVTPFGVNLQHFRPDEKIDDVFRVIHCGGITFRKGVPYLLQAFGELDLPNSELWLVGKVDPEMEGVLNRHKNDKIILKGTFPQNELYNVYSQASVFCLASLEEGLAMVIPQAMACGLPILATHATGAGELVEDGREGFLFDSGNVEMIKDRIQKLYAEPQLLAKMRKNCLEGSTGNLSWSRYGERCVDCYERLLQTKETK